MNHPELVRKGIAHCQVCGTLENLTKHGVGSSGRTYYFCNPCNTARCKSWRNKEGNMDRVYSIARTYSKKNPERRKAWNAVSLKKISKKPCQVCGAEKVHAHHPKPKKRLLIVFLCPLHHKQVHRGLLECPEAVDYSLSKE